MSAIPLRLLPDSSTIGTDDSLSIGGVRVAELAAQYGTPLFVYDEEHLRARCRAAVNAFGAGNVVYATKAFICGAMARLAHEEGLLLDVATGGELHTVLHAGVPASSCVLHGNNKSLDELRMAIAAGIDHIVVDSFDEIDRIEKLHADGLPVVRIQLRITPGVHVHTHEYVSTGQDDSKFGFNLNNGDAHKAIARAQSSVAIDLIGIHCHIGSQIFEVDGFKAAAQRLVAVLATFRDKYSKELAELNIGGGYGIAYTKDESGISPDVVIPAIASVIKDECAKAKLALPRISIEPGRAIVGPTTTTLYLVGTTKSVKLDSGSERRYISVDGGMSENINGINP